MRLASRRSQPLRGSCAALSAIAGKQGCAQPHRLRRRPAAALRAGATAGARTRVRPCPTWQGARVPPACGPEWITLDLTLYRAPAGRR